MSINRLSVAEGIALDGSTQTDAKGIQSIDVGFRLVQALLEAGQPLPLKTLAAAADMSPSKAHNYIVSFRRVRMVSKDLETGHYGLGPMVGELGLSYLAQRDGLNVGERAIRVIRERVKKKAWIATSMG